MKLTALLLEPLPCLGWVANVSHNRSSVHVRHGWGVEVRERFFFEGAWAGTFESGHPDRTEVVFGSGAVIEDDDLTFIPSLALCDSLHWCEMSDKSVWVSNSLPLLLSFTGRRLDPTCPDYDRLNDSRLLGIEHYERALPTDSDPISRLAYHNLRVSQDDISIVPKPSPPRFPDFAAYHGYLERTVEALTGNAQDLARVHPLKIFTTQSRGYDTTAVNALARDRIDLAFTIAQAKEVGRYAGEERGTPDSDDGTQICSVLGIRALSIDRFAYRKEPEWELLFRAGIHNCQDLNFVGVFPQIERPSLLLTGVLGQIWYPEGLMGGRAPGDDLRAWDQGGYGLGEVRLQAGFIQAPIPAIGARRYSDIARITESSSMDAWRVGGSYDRPIPRRIAEAAGVPRDIFGQRKMATVIEAPEPELPLDGGLRGRYLKWLCEADLRKPWQLTAFRLIQKFNALTARRYLPGHRWLYYSERLVAKTLRRDWTIPMLWKDLRGSLYVYAVNTLADQGFPPRPKSDVVRPPAPDTSGHA